MERAWALGVTGGTPVVGLAGVVEPGAASLQLACQIGEGRGW